MSESLPSSDPGAQKRRSTRIVQAVPITVSGVDALGQPFKERTTTVAVNCHGCKYQSKHYVPKNSALSLEIPRQEAASLPRIATGHVVWVQRPRTVRELFQIGVEFETAGNVWGIAFPPGDWFPCPDEKISAVPASPETPAAEPDAAEIQAATSLPFGVAPLEKNAETPVPSATPTAAPASPGGRGTTTPAAMETFAVPPAPAVPPASADESKIHVMPPPAQSQEAQLAFSRQMAKMVAEARETLDKTIRRGAQTAINEEMTVVRQQLDAQIHETIEHAIKTSMERVSEAEVKKVVLQATLRTAAIAEEARKASASVSEQLDAKIQRAVQEAISRAGEQAAKDSAQQVSGQDLKQAAEQAVQRALAEREADSPSLRILSSPEAARKHLDEWKKNLEETAQGIRSQEIEQSRSEAASASRRWREEFEAAVAGSSQNLHETLNRVSEQAATRAERDIAEHSASFRAMLHEAISGTQASLQSLGAELARAEETKEHLAETTRAALDRTRAQLDELLSAQREDIQRRTDEIIAARVQQIEPVLRNSSQAALDRFAGEMDRQLSPKLEEARKAASELTDTREIASKLPGDIREQIQQISRQTIEESAERLRQETAKSLAEFEQSRRVSLSKIEEELEQKSSETQHATYDALLKASEWYQKKAQTAMQSSLEKAAEQSVSALRDRAGEISRLVTSELDHYRRTYVEHGKAEMEEAAKEVADLERRKLNDNAEAVNAALADRIHQAATESLRRFQEASREAIEKARSDMEYNREGLVAEFQKKIDEKMTQGAEHAATYLQSQIVPLLETWEAQREEERRIWTVQLRKAEEEAIEHYKIRLENATNSWLLASAATLGQNSQAVLDTLARTAEKRLRDTCSRVLAGMGDTLKQSLLGISGDLNISEEDEPFKNK